MDTQAWSDGGERDAVAMRQEADRYVDLLKAKLTEPLITQHKFTLAAEAVPTVPS